MDKFILKSNNNAYKIGFGTLGLTKSDTPEIILEAIKCGYRYIDTAQSYFNEEMCGIALQKAIDEKIVTRNELFITTKLSPHRYNDYENTIKYVKESFNKLGLDYIDLFLIHHPNTTPDDRWKNLNAEIWRALEEFVEQGKIKYIGVSNFSSFHLKELLKTAKIKPVCNQSELSPMWHQQEMVDFCKKENILMIAWQHVGGGQLLKNKNVINIASKINRTPAQVCLRWSIQKGYIPVVKSSNKERIASNFNIFDFKLSDEDIAILDDLNSNSATHFTINDSYRLWSYYDRLNLKQYVSSTKIKLFNLFTIFLYKNIDDKIKKIYLFKILHLFTIKLNKQNMQTAYLFGIFPVFTIKIRKSEKRLSMKWLPDYD